MNKQRSGALVEWLAAIALVLGAFVAGEVHGAAPPPAAAAAPPAKVSEITSAVLIGIDDTAYLLIFIRADGSHFEIPADACAELAVCMKTYETLAAANKVNAVVIRTKSPDTATQYDAAHAAHLAPLARAVD